MLEVPGEAPHPVDQAAEDPATRAALLESDGLDRAAVALSGVLGVEGLPGEEAERLLAAHDEGLAALPERFGRWASVSLLEPSAEAVEAQLAERRGRPDPPGGGAVHARAGGAPGAAAGAAGQAEAAAVRASRAVPVGATPRRPPPGRTGGPRSPATWRR